MDIVVVRFIPPNHWWERAKWELREDYTSVNGEVNVPTGFITDGASIPFFARSWFSPTGEYFGAAIIHDYILISENDWSFANDQFRKEMKALNIAPWRRHIIMWTVDMWKWIHT